MIKRYLLPVALLLLLGITLVFLPEKKDYDQSAPEAILKDMTSVSRFISPDRVADRMIQKDPSLMMIDVRPAEEFQAYSLPGAFNIPLSGILEEQNQELLNQEGLDFVFFSNNDVYADRAWILCRRIGLENIYVMKGGLNQWFENFFKTPAPPESASLSDIELYQFRLGVRQYFTGGEIRPATQSAVETITVKPRAKKSATEGGC